MKKLFRRSKKVETVPPAAPAPVVRVAPIAPVPVAPVPVSPLFVAPVAPLNNGKTITTGRLEAPLAKDGADVSTFGGFDTWLSSFTPAPVIPVNKNETENFAKIGFSTHKHETVLVDDAPRPELECSEDQVVARFVGLKPKYGRKETKSRFEMRIDVMAKVEAIIEQLHIEGYEKPLGFYLEGPDRAVSTMSSNEDKCPVYVTEGPFCYDIEQGLKINENETLGTFARQVLMPVRCVNDHLNLRDGTLNIGLHRTLRVPENGQFHDLPPDFGLLPLQNFATISERVSNMQSESLISMVKKGGVFVPLYQREAMWISFHSENPFVIRTFAGGINVITGKTWKAEKNASKQDYVVLPEQHWIDGIAVDGGTVKQFVAMPTGSGYSVEFQKTGSERISGMQFEIIPSGLTTGSKLFSAEGIPPIDSSLLHKSPRQYGIPSGQDILFDVKEETSGRSPRPMFLRELGKVGQSMHSSFMQAIIPIYQILILVQYDRSTTKDTENIIASPLWTIEYLMHQLPLRNGTAFYEGKELRHFAQTSTLFDSGIRSERSVISVLGAVRSQPAAHQSYSLSANPYHESSDNRRWETFSPPYRGPTRSNAVQTGKQRAEGPHSSPGYAMDMEYYGGAHPDTSLPVFQVAELGISAPGNIEAAAPAPYEVSLPPIARLPTSETSAIVKTPKMDGWEMTLAAGGNIKQTIRPDTYDPAIWDTWLATVVNVQLLNSVAYSTLTGKPPPPSPITAEEYRKAGLPFYREYEDSVPGSGDFGAIKSVGGIDGTRAITIGANLAANSKLACTSCRKNFCDKILRPCNHAFCTECITKKMTWKQTAPQSSQSQSVPDPVYCAICGAHATSSVAFSAPMALPGRGDEDLSMLPVVTTGGFEGARSFQSVKGNNYLEHTAV